MSAVASGKDKNEFNDQVRAAPRVARSPTSSVFLGASRVQRNEWGMRRLPKKDEHDRPHRQQKKFRAGKRPTWKDKK